MYRERVSSPRRIPAWVPPASIAVAGAAAYADSLHDAFLFDDVVAIVDNPAIRHLGALGAVLSPAGEAATVQGRPLLGLTLAINYAFSGANPLGYHLVNIALHVLAGLTLYAIIRSATRGFAIAWAAALLWTVHPLQTEAVTYVVQRAESLMGLCYLATFLCYIRFAQTKRPAWAVGAVACCLAGMGAKEVMVSAPVMLWMYDRAFLSGTFAGAWRARRGLLLALAATWLPLIGFVASGGGNRGGSVGFGVAIRPMDYWLTQGEALLHYLRLVYWPAPLVLDYGRFIYSNPAEGAIRGGLVAILLAASVWAWRRAPRVGFLALFFFAILAPTSLLPGTTQMIAEHRMYLASIPVIVLTVLGFERALGPRRLAFWPLAAAALALLTWSRNRAYRTPESIWADTVAKRPGNAVAHYDLGYVLGPSPRAVAELREAIRLNPGYLRAYDVLGYDLSLEPGGREEAMQVYRRALSADPRDIAAAHNLAELLVRAGGRLAGQGRRDEALSAFGEAVRLAPDNSQAHDSLGWLLFREGGHEAEALAQFEAAVRCDPANARAHSNLASALAAADRPDAEVIRELREAVRLDPTLIEARFNLALMLARDPRQRAQAIAELGEVLRLRPGFGPAETLLRQLEL